MNVIWEQLIEAVKTYTFWSCFLFYLNQTFTFDFLPHPLFQLNGFKIHSLNELRKIVNIVKVKRDEPKDDKPVKAGH